MRGVKMTVFRLVAGMTVIGTLVLAAWLFTPSSKKKYLWFKSNSTSINGGVINTEIVSNFNPKTNLMSGTIYINYSKDVLDNNKCKLVARLAITGLDATKPQNLDYPNRHLTTCSINDAYCSIPVSQNEKGRIHLYFSNTQVNEIEVELQTVKIKGITNTGCNQETKLIKQNPRWKGISRWKRLLSR